MNTEPSLKYIYTEENRIERGSQFEFSHSVTGDADFVFLYIFKTYFLPHSKII